MRCPFGSQIHKHKHGENIIWLFGGEFWHVTLIFEIFIQLLNVPLARRMLFQWGVPFIRKFTNTFMVKTSYDFLVVNIDIFHECFGLSRFLPFIAQLGGPCPVSFIYNSSPIANRSRKHSFSCA